MSNSLKFCQEIASDPKRSGYFNRDWSKAVELNSEVFFKNVVGNLREWEIKDTLKDELEKTITINLTINPEADFDYFTSSSSIHDGTLLFNYENIIKCICNVVTGSTYNKKLGEHNNGDIIYYTVGNLIVLDEFDKDGNMFVSEEKPYLRQRTTVLLPIKMKKTIKI